METLDCDKAKDQQNDEEDNESLPEHCWVTTSKNDSRKWLIRDASYTLPKERLASTTRATYLYPQVRDESENTIGQRTKEMLKRFEEEAIREIIEEKHVDCTVDYCTEYDGNYNGSGFQVGDRIYEADQEIYKKYPLYRSTPTSFYSFKLSKDPRGLLTGHTVSTDPLQPFKKCAGFSKPMIDKLDNHIWLPGGDDEGYCGSSTGIRIEAVIAERVGVLKLKMSPGMTENGLILAPEKTDGDIF